MTGPPQGGCPQGEIWQGYPNCECITAPPQPAQAKKVWFKPCKYNYNPVTIDRTKKMTIDGQTPVVGDIFEIDLGPQDGFWNPSMNGAFVPMRVVHVTQPPFFPPSQTLDFDSSHCKSLPPHEPIGISHAKVSKGGDKDGWIDKTFKETPGEEMEEPRGKTMNENITGPQRVLCECPEGAGELGDEGGTCNCKCAVGDVVCWTSDSVSDTQNIKLKESDLVKIVKRLINEGDKEPRLPKLNPQLGDESYLKKLITSMDSVDEFTSWFDKTYGPYREAGADIPMGREVISIQEGSRRRLNERIPWWTIVGGIFGMITAGIKAWESVQHLCCNQVPEWSCCTSGGGGESTGSGPSPIKLKESDLTKIIKRIISEQNTNPFSGGGSGPNWDAAQAAWTNWNSDTQGSAPNPDATFLSNMAGKGCGFYENRLTAQVNSFVQKFGGSFGSGANQTNTSGGMNPAWQSQKYARIMWLSDKVQDCNSTSSNVSQCIIDFIDDPANDGPLDSALCVNGNQAINQTNKENTKFRHRSIADCGMLNNKLTQLTNAIATETGCNIVRKQAKHDYLTSLKNSCC